MKIVNNHEIIHKRLRTLTRLLNCIMETYEDTNTYPLERMFEQEAIDLLKEIQS